MQVSAILVEEYERELELNLPSSFKDFLLQKRSAIIDGFSIMGISTKEVPINIIQATSLLRHERPDLPSTLVPVVFIKSKAVCLDISRSANGDVPLAEVSLQEKDAPLDIGYTFSEWLEYHQNLEARSRVAWQRIRNRQKEARGSTIQDWSTPVFKVQDYVVALGAFRFSFVEGCLEIDEFFPIPQPNVAARDPVKVLLSEAFARGRDYCGCLKLTFTRDIREDENGRMSPKKDWDRIKEEYNSGQGNSLKGWRIPAAVPEEITELAAEYGVSLSGADKGVIEHYEAVDLWFRTLDLPEKVIQRIEELEKAGFAKKEVITELIYTNVWTREEVAWAFLNASRPEALILGSDYFGDRLSYAESLNFGRSAFIATRLRDAIMAEMNQGLSLEDTENAKAHCFLEPRENRLWTLGCDQDFCFPFPSHKNLQEKRWFRAEEPILMLCQPFVPHNMDRELPRLTGYLKQLLNDRSKVQAKCLVLSNEYISPYYCPYWEQMEKFVQKAREKGVEVFFAPARMDVYLDEEIKNRMYKVKSLAQFSSREEEKKLQIIEVPEEYWNLPEESRANRAIQNASQSAKMFAYQLVHKREVKRYGHEFSLMCEVLEREASQNHRIIADVEGELSLELESALKREGKMEDITLPFVRPEEMDEFKEKLKSESLLSPLREVTGGIVVVVKHWEQEYISPQQATTELHQESFTFPASLRDSIDQNIDRKKQERIYASNWKEIDKAHSILRESLQIGVPYGLASLLGKVRANVFVEMIRDYIRVLPSSKELNLFISYGDGSQGGPLSLFSLPSSERPDDHLDLFRYNMGTVSCRHMEADKFVDRYLIRNREIQHRENSTDQENLAYSRTWESVEEILKFLRGDLTIEDDLSLNMRILLDYIPIIKNRNWPGLSLQLYHTTGLESAEIGVYRAILDLLKKYQGELIVTPRILIPSGYYKKADPWY